MDFRRLTEEEIKKLLYSYGKNYRKLRFLADALGMSYQRLTYWINKVGSNRHLFYRDLVCKLNCTLVEVRGCYRYQVLKHISRCSCHSSYNVFVVNISEDDLYEILTSKGFIVKREKDRLVVSSPA